ncbi:Galactose-binding domain-like protein [Niveomyces insectorum RCEF 264]|uniref:Galactose-binding domain-like protein n=1 Tax=Niveomyces insectorum RCEF 264 TaxID=1081102 RepID=A0A167X0J4_9HYPO|nr:Galactose-binding domain-like protein [Niveomyces insectorum RCEF 264]
MRAAFVSALGLGWLCPALASIDTPSTSVSIMSLSSTVPPFPSPVVCGPNLVTNGDFTDGPDGLDGWNADNLAQVSTATACLGGAACAIVTGRGPGFNALIQPVATVPNVVYTIALAYNVLADDDGQGIFNVLADLVPVGGPNPLQPYNTWRTYKAQFRATSESTIMAYTLSSPVTGQTTVQFADIRIEACS